MMDAPEPNARIDRVYSAVTPDQGQRVLVDRLWPRGLRRDDPRRGLWMPHAAPSGQLRRWYGHDPARFAEFSDRYAHELTTPGPAADAVAELRAMATQGPVTLVTATKDLNASHVVTLARVVNTGA